jgi:hypothetical protein
VIASLADESTRTRVGIALRALGIQLIPCTVDTISLGDIMRSGLTTETALWTQNWSGKRCRYGLTISFV